MQTILYKFNDWGFVKGSEQTVNGREIITIGIGEYQENGRCMSYITEPIYKNIMDDMRDNTRDYEITVQPGTTPMLVIISGGVIVIHNEEMKTHISELKHVLEKADAATIMEAYAELRLSMNGKSKLNAATALLMAFIEKNTNKHYSNVLVRAVIHTIIEERYYSTDDNEVKEWMRSLDYVDLVQLSCSLMRFKLDGIIDSELQDFGDILNPDIDKEDQKNKDESFMRKLETLLGQELILRLFKGTIENRQTSKKGGR